MVMLVGCSRTSDNPPAVTQPTSTVIPNTDGDSSPSTTPTTTATATPATTTPNETATVNGSILAVDPDHASEAATNLSSTTRCDLDNPGQPLAELAWTPAADGGRAQRVQVSVDPRGFVEPLVGPELPADAASTLWSEITGQAFHEWRVLTGHDGKWVTSPTAQFEGPTCAIDYQPER